MSGVVFPLQDNQLPAADPNGNVWLSASAGTGKTQVLSARVLRLLLTPGVEPSQILCLTFTKAGAAEMANRINAVLARWVRLDTGALAKDLKYLGAPFDPDTQAHARTLFASVLDCPGGGLRIDTIHAFSQWLLANFPEESGLTPGARPMEDRERELLAREVLAEMLGDGDTAFADAVSHFAKEKSPDDLRAWLMRCAGAALLWDGPGSWQPPMRARVLRLLDMPADADEAWAVEGLHPDIFPDAHLRAIFPLMQAWNAKTGAETAGFIAKWLTLDHAARVDAYSGFFDTVLKKNGDPRKMGKPSRQEPRLPQWQQHIADALTIVAERRALLALADFLVPALEMGRAFALRWEKAKTRDGLLDFDDLIRRAAILLGTSDAAAWIRYKLDRSFDHILIDEAQDTNAAQWNIIDALIDDFFAGEGASGDKLRTIFTVGDYKQAIFGFQGTSPENFERAKLKVKKRIEDARAHAHEMRENRRLPTWNDLDLDRSFRTALPVLDFVNRAIKAIGHEAFGLTDVPPPHVGDDRAGLVAMWPPVIGEAEGPEAEEGEEQRDWLPAHDTLLADKIAEQVRLWVSKEQPFVLEKGTRRNASAGDIMVLVRKRKDLARQIVAKLHGKGVAVAGVDRLRLGDPLAVKDMMAALKFAAQPLDDLSLANLLASPLIGWTQDDLLAFCPRKGRKRLWDHLRKHEDSFVLQTVEKLRELLARADFETPQDLLSWLLTGPWSARAKLVARLGIEANDPIDEFVNAAFAYQSAHTASLAGFIAWFEAGEGELKRDPDAASGQVRVLTVHGSKGLQAPIVILADATGDPGDAGMLELVDDPMGGARDQAGSNSRKVPLPPFKKDECAGPVSAAREEAQIAAMQEHWRLLYVAMTRAEEALFIGGSLGAQQAKKGEPHQDSWYAHLAPLFDSPPQEDGIWGLRREWGSRADPVFDEDGSGGAPTKPELPYWAITPIGPEPRPPRPLAPSSAGEDKGADPPLATGAGKQAARRGILIHRLLERLPELEVEQREKAGAQWLMSQAHDLDAATRDEMLSSALAVLDHPDFSAIFSSQALAEVPLAAAVNGVVVAGTADRLLVTSDAVTVVDFKTTRRPPEKREEIPGSTLRQMAAYAGALAAIYPDRDVRAAVLYTHAPVLFEIATDTLAAHNTNLGAAEDNYTAVPIE